MSKVLMKGNEALGEAAIRAGCVHFFGYPITPQTEVPEYLVKRLPEVGGAFVQAESEVAAINMVYGAAGVGIKCMTSSSSPGISLMAEGLSYLAACELPCVVINIMRAGPGLGGILPSQSDYLQATKGHGHGDYQLIVLAPASVQEAVDLMTLAFELAEKYRNPVMVCADGMIGQMMEPVEFASEGRGKPFAENEWELTGRKGRTRRIVNSLFLAPEQLFQHNIQLKAKYDRVHRDEMRWELYGGDGPYDLLLVAFGTMARICKTAIDEARREGLRVALFRPITLNPFPMAACRAAMDAMAEAGRVLSVEMNMGQMVQDVRYAAAGSRTVDFYGTAGGIVPSPDQVAAEIRQRLTKSAHAQHKENAMPDPLKPVVETTLAEKEATPILVWRGSGRCPEAQGDGVPCAGTDGTCDTCGRALPIPVAAG
jgi:2-oxoglutarate ferredoxin oxidoreductase subunit alpha